MPEFFRAMNTPGGRRIARDVALGPTDTKTSESSSAIARDKFGGQYLVQVTRSAKASHPTTLPQDSFERGKTAKANLP